MTEEGFARQEVAIGAKVYFNQGVWWREMKPFYCWPLHLLHTINRGESKPPAIHSLIGYEHPVPEKDQANAVLPVIMMRNLRQYSIAGLSAKKRNQVRRGIGSFTIKPIDNIISLLEDGYYVNLSALRRQRWGGDRSHYSVRRKWVDGVEMTFGLPGRENWGAFMDGRLVAYLRAYQIDRVAYIYSMMSHSDYLSQYPNDGLIHKFLLACQQEGTTDKVVFGLKCAKQSLNDYKMKFGFEEVGLPVWRHLNPVVKVVARHTRYRHYVEYKGGIDEVS